MKKVLIITMTTMMSTGVFAAPKTPAPPTLAALCNNGGITFLYNDAGRKTENFQCEVKDGKITITSHTQSTLMLPDSLTPDYGLMPTPKDNTPVLKLANDPTALKNIYAHGSSGMAMTVSTTDKTGPQTFTMVWGKKGWVKPDAPGVFDLIDDVDPNSPAYKEALASLDKLKEEDMKKGLIPMTTSPVVTKTAGFTKPAVVHAVVVPKGKTNPAIVLPPPSTDGVTQATPSDEDAKILKQISQMDKVPKSKKSVPKSGIPNGQDPYGWDADPAPAPIGRTN